ncbi:MAG: hypothetical protein COT91_02720 [Candidatus Doudnabacteria bacterium CG10_big_fil_rev_8_21_14_0_10_41_10]|uniref:Uncharacterized protein n=1 Tax=Candidatus Doudnabacteria bacterium CG10_big_fil_rev_8_21_14_0_10_41_10 TaxID=1974551 RepID=A0A2H0VDN2_9BACT|nr:MAG: hypothetical protein COT91_02720 [Candidatus Doudnabacteria bacterium CG10_big_fil_rev_8_21_14_0_10_41_10]
MSCNETGCSTPVTVENAFVPSLAEVSAVAKKPVVDLTAEELLLVAICDECAALHIMCGDTLISVEASLTEIARCRQNRADRAAERRARRESRQAAAKREAGRHTLGAVLLAAGLTPSVRLARR